MRLNESDSMSWLSLRDAGGMVVRVVAEEGFRRQPARQISFPGFSFLFFFLKTHSNNLHKSITKQKNEQAGEEQPQT